MEWMLDIQLGRRNLSPIQRIAIAEKYRSLYEKQAKERQGTCTDLKDNFVPKLAQSKPDNRVNTKLADVAGVGKETYRMGAKIFSSDDEDLKQRVLSGETAISTGYKELVGKKENKKVEDDNEASTTITQPITTSPTLLKPQISEEVRQICEDLKTLVTFWGKIRYVIRNDFRRIALENTERTFK